MKKAIFALLAAGVSTAPLSAQGRLFAVDWVIPQAQAASRYAAVDAAAPQGLFGNIYELDPTSGAILNQFDAPEYTSGPEGLAFDGTSLWFVHANDFEPVAPEGPAPPPAVLYELNPDTGAVIDADPLPGLQTVDGLAPLGPYIYILDYEADVVHVFDPATDTLIGSVDIGAANPQLDFIGGFDAYEAGGLLMATADVINGFGGGLSSHVLVFFDVFGTVYDSFPLAGEFDAGVAALGTTIYTGEYETPFGIDLYDPNGNLLETFDVPFGVSGLAAGGVQPPTVVEVPAISPGGAALLALTLFAAAIVSLRRRA